MALTDDLDTGWPVVLLLYDCLFFGSLFVSWASLIAQMVKILPALQDTWVQSLGQEYPWRKECQPTPVFLPGKSHGQKSLFGYNPWGCKELDMTEILTH